MHKYLKEHIIEELEGAEDYWKKAVENKGADQGNIFKEMAEAKLVHANSLFKMFNNLEPNDDSLDYYQEIIETYTKTKSNIKNLKEEYEKG